MTSFFVFAFDLGPAADGRAFLPIAGTLPVAARLVFNDSKIARTFSCDDCGNGFHFFLIVFCEMCRTRGERCANACVEVEVEVEVEPELVGLEAPMVLRQYLC